ncbi:type III-A CRISPR-associated protein Csm2 [Thermophagus xiamenensis]|uniref:CRISPR system Cms protein Csm2 n=1 Tax=Thermophagus xiamenensis TaxID=385682 RepID=A0A1I2C9D3_9BACT|nr:type III-A CRISPR-associated protein Csm2 [Thermophagus xiamenensis]SFE64805.1 CRISPR type III-A/MTUBE-associated protein Csm2 [Thermophagus xiamenensis]
MNSHHQRKAKTKNQKKSDEELLKAIKEEDFHDYPDCLLSFTKGDSPEKKKQTIDELKEFVRKNGKKVSASQVRNLYARARAAKNEVQLQLLRPQIAYMLARQDSSNSNETKKFFLLPDDLIGKGISLSEFLKVFEAIVAYHKVYGEKN